MTRRLAGRSAASISSAGLYAELCPEMGGRVLQLATRDGRDVLVPAPLQSFDVNVWPRGGAYPLFPYHNRLENAKITVDSETTDLSPHPAAAPHTLHGPSHTQPWQPVLHENSRFVMSLRYCADDHWPWSFKASQEFVLEGDRLSLIMSITNTDRRRMPAGLGWHPYFASEDTVFAKAEFLWPHKSDYLPVGFRENVVDQTEIDSRETRYMQGWNSALVRCTPNLAAIVHGDPVFDFLVVHRGDPRHICVEPVSHAPNAWNLGSDPGTSGARLLDPGKSLSGKIVIDVDPSGRRTTGAN